DANKKDPKNIFEPVIGQVAWEDIDSSVVLNLEGKLYIFKGTKDVKAALESGKLPEIVTDGTKVETKDVEYNGQKAVLVTIYLGKEKLTIYELYTGELSSTNMFKGKVAARLYPEKRVINGALVTGILVRDSNLKFQDLPDEARAKMTKQLGPIKAEEPLQTISYYIQEGESKFVNREDLGIYGYSIETGEKEFTVKGYKGEPYKFKLVSQVNTEGNVLREFAMVGAQELIIFGMNRQMFIVNKKVLKDMGIDDKEGGTFIGYEEKGTFTALWRIHSSQDKEYKELADVSVYPDEPQSESLKSVIDALWEKFKDGGELKEKYHLTYTPNPNAKEFHLFELNVLTPDRKVVGKSYQFYDGGTRRIIISNYVLEDGMPKKTGWFIDYEVERDAGSNKLGGFSLRFDVDEYMQTKKFVPVAVAPYITPGDSMVFDLRDGNLPILEKRNNPNLYLMERWHFTAVKKPINASGKEFDLTSPEDLNDIVDFAKNQFKEDGKVVDVESQGVLKLDSKEKFHYDYEEIERIITDLNEKFATKLFTEEEKKNLKETLNKYSPVALKIYGVPAFTLTEISNPKNEESEGSVSMIKDIKNFIDRPTIIFRNKSIIKEKTSKKLLGTDPKLVYSDFKGNRFITSNDGSVTYVYGFDKYGRGQLSIRTVAFEKGKKFIDVSQEGPKVIDDVSIYGSRDTLSRKIAFIRFQGEILAYNQQGELISLGNDIEADYQNLKNVELKPELITMEGKSYSGLQKLTVELKDGQGMTKISLSSPDMQLADLMSGATSLKAWVNLHGLDELINSMNEITFLDYRPEDAKQFYVSLIASRIAYEAWSHKVKRTSNGQVILDENAYLNERKNSFLSRLFGSKYLDHTYEPEFIKGSILLQYKVDTNRPGYADSLKVTTLSGRSVRETVPYTLIKVMLGILGNSTSGKVTTYYDSLGMPIEARLSNGQLVQTWTGEGLGVWFYAAEKGIGTVMEQNRKRELGRDNQFDRIKTILINGLIKDESRVGIKEAWISELRNGWHLVIMPVVILLALVFLGKIFDALRVMLKKHLIISGKKDASQNKGEVKTEPLAIVEPSYKAYGFDSNVVDSAKYRYNGELKGQVLGGAVTLRLQRGESIAQIASEYFEAYNVTRKTVYGLKPLDFTAMDEKEVAEMLWISFLIRGGSIYAHNDTPSYLNYLIHKALEEYKKNPDNVSKMVRTHVDRWWTINYWASTSFKSFGAEGATANSLPAQYLFTVEDLEELFRIPAFVKFYDGLGEENRKALYDDKLIPELIEYAKLLKAQAAELNKRYDKNKIRIKKAIVKTKEYKDYVRFLEGEWKKEKPLFLKTYPDTIGFKGLGTLKTWLHTFRNLYQPLAIPFQVVIFALGAALYLQMNNPAINLNITMPLIAALVIGLTIALWSGRPIISFFLNRGFEKRVNTKAYGKPVGPSVGYKMLNIPLYLKLFRHTFWFTLLSIKGLWNAVVLYIVLYAHANIITGQWLILGMNFNMVLVAGLWFPFILFFFLDTFSIYYAFEALWGYFQARFIGLGHIKTEGRKEALRRISVSKLENFNSAKSRAEKEDLLVAMIKANFIP
ncbi:MAG: hypothetical protein WCY05_05920, partial [Candidatus Omnitrophota bacterium]